VQLARPPDNPIFAISERAAALRAAGLDVISLAAGEPQAATSDAVIAATEVAIRDPVNHHYGAAAGLLELREEVARRYPDGVLDPDTVQLALGSKHALHLALTAVLRPGDDVLLIRPTWPGHIASAVSAGAAIVTVPAGPDGLVDPGMLRRARTARTRAFLFANPANPSGAIHPAERVAEIGRWCSANGIWLLSDEVYSGLVYDGCHSSALEAVDDRGRLIVVDGVSKAHAMTGWRVGWLMAAEPVIAAARKEVAATITNVPLITQHAALAALRDRTTVQRAAQRYRQGRDILVDRLASVPGLDCPRPAGGMFAFPDLGSLLDSGRWSSSTQLADWLLEQVRVAVVPGDVFGADSHLRISFAVAHDQLTVAADRLVDALSRQ
jgi:aspartate/methionine/tyrosine aminotransferase